MRYVDPKLSDWRWFRRQLIAHLCIMMGMVLFFAFHRSVLPVPTAHAEAEQETVSEQSHPMLPSGWRRTKQGWKHISPWTARPTLNEVITTQREREPRWAQLALEQLRRVPPWMFAVIQITAIAAIIAAGRKDPATAEVE